MTKIYLSKSGINVLEIFSGKIDETIVKEVINWSDFVGPADWKSVDPTNGKLPSRIAYDTLNLKRTFLVTGTIKKESGIAFAYNSVPYIRNDLVNMMRYGGVLEFRYGDSTDTEGEYPDGTKKTYYTGTSSYKTENVYFWHKFNCHITRLQISEIPKGGARTDETPKDVTGKYGTPHNMPEEYSLVIELTVMEDMSG